MKKKLIILIVVTLFITLMFSTGCKKKFVWNPAGAWLLEVNCEKFGTWTENVTLSGNESGGTISGWDKFNPSSTLGTWTKTGNYTVSINIHFVNVLFTNTVDITGTTTKESPNMVTLTGIWTEVSGFFGTAEYNMTVTAHKTSELQ